MRDGSPVSFMLSASNGWAIRGRPAQEEEIARFRVGGLYLGVEDESRLVGIEGGDVNTTVLGVEAVGEIKKVPAVR